MRAVFGVEVRATKYSIWTLAAVLVALSSVLTPLAAAPVTYGLALADEPSAAEESDQQKQDLANGTPTATSPGDIRPEGAAITWTSTGRANIEDTYDLIVARQGAVDESEVLTSDIVMTQTGLTQTRQDISSLGAGTYHWQVRSCAAGTFCKQWSKVYAVNVDGTAPGIPTAQVASSQYDRLVSMNGLAEAGSGVTVRVGETTCAAVADSAGAWSCAFTEEMDYGNYEAAVTAADKAGNVSLPFELAFGVKELFVAPPIKAEEIPTVLEVVPVSTAVENKVFKQPLSVIDAVNMGEELDEPEGNVLGAVHPLSTEGGVVQASESGWQVLGMPWFMWAGMAGILSAGWFVSSGRMSRSFSLS